MEDSWSNQQTMHSTPWFNHLRKLGSLIKCPICLELLKGPVLLPCDHFICNSCIQNQAKNGSKCHVCNEQYADREIRSAPYMENVIAVYKSLCSVPLAELFHPPASGDNSISGRPLCFPNGCQTKTSIGQKGYPCIEEEIALESINMTKLKSDLSPRTCSFSEINKDSKKRKKSNLSEPDECGFCHSSKVTDETGPILHIANQELLHGDLASFSKVISIHKVCIDWTPMVYFEGEKIKNLDIELARAAKLKCSGCGEKGAALGCYVKSCRKTYHVPCALKIPNCKWDSDNFLMLCPSHKSNKFPRKILQREKYDRVEAGPLASRLSSGESNFWSASPHGAKTWVFCGSALSSMDLCYLVKFARRCDATVARSWRPDITHVITATDANGACTRTMKVLMAILHGRWIISMDWIKSCSEANRPVDEKHYEVTLDNHGSRNGPRTGRQLALDNGPKLFGSHIFYFSGNFDSALMDNLKTLVHSAGGFVIENKEHLVSQSCVAKGTSRTLIVYNADDFNQWASGDKESHMLEIPEAAEDLALRIGSRVVQHTWILESIAACKLQPLSCY
ncbi:BRCA1-associated RING domain protein 1 [Daucus carota subsp. sativus]|uniref:BRCA1-associated RING domain protein 1 n=1 Tax=Daucus carota subsp. sativus TaxID=79200 RepID=UPI0007EFB359|nr:PREDICTED: BRCA1-associated RING domain protein 1-like [Daucus carota subsp. sativus]